MLNGALLKIKRMKKFSLELGIIRRKVVNVQVLECYVLQRLLTLRLEHLTIPNKFVIALHVLLLQLPKAISFPQLRNYSICPDSIRRDLHDF